MRIVFVGLAGVPKLSRACDVRLSFFANLLSKQYSVSIINRYSSKSKEVNGSVKLNGSIDVREIITSKNTGLGFSILLFLLSVLIEPFVIIHENKKQKIDILHLYTNHYIDYLIYWIVSKFIGAKVVTQYVEYRSAFESNKRSLYHRFNGLLCDKYGAKLWDGAIPISDFLLEQAKAVNPKLKCLKVTPLCDFKTFEMNNKSVEVDGDYLLYCGSVAYYEVVDVIIESYQSSLISKQKKLVLVLSGDAKVVEKIAKNNPDISVLSRLDYDVLIALYKHAFGLLIPLKSTISEIARFPNKVCEYLAAKGLVITTNFGEMRTYFVDGKNAIVAEEFSVASIRAKLDDLSLNRYDVELIKNAAYELGWRVFDMNSYNNTIFTFFDSICLEK